jgi:two-component system sensor histidine kinase RpfC
VLIGDDNQTNRMVLQHMVGRLGHVTRLCDGGEAVLSALESDEFDVVIIDKNMPEMGGLEAFTAYRLNHGGTAPVPFVLLTADATEESRSESKRAGIEYFLTKPVSIATLQSTLEKACAAAGTAVKAPRSVPAAVAPADPPTPETGVQGLPHVERQVLDTMIEFAEQPAQFRREIIASFRQDVAEDIRHMSQAILTGNQAGFSDYAHALKGSAAYMGMPRLVVFCESAQHLPPDQFEHQVSAVFREITEEIDAALLELAELPQLRSAGKARKPGRG